MAHSSRQPKLEAAAPPFVFVTVGTDHHQFDRIIDWVESWLSGVARDVECFFQTGTSRVPRDIPSSPLIPHDQLREYCGRAVAVVCHGGPSTIMDCRRAGRKPIVVPRREALGEHVDDHQLLFARRAAQSDLIELIEDAAALGRLLDAAIDDIELLSIDASSDAGRLGAVRRFALLADALVGLDPRRT